jgi:FkbM family methyltransferase
VTHETEVTAVGGLGATIKRRIGWLIRDRFPFRPVVREVQGVEMVLPWSHRLPDYATWGPRYGQNLVDVARLLAERGSLTVLDVGANVGDSALQILHAADARVLCVEGDRAYLTFLHRNVDADERVTVVEVLLTPEDQESGRTAVRTGGTTRFVDGRGEDAMPTVSAARLRAEHPEFADLRLVKSDTDGYDVELVPAIAEAWADARPVLFFEYDPYLTRLAGLDPVSVWPRLERLGYRRVAVWDNGAAPLGQSTTAEVAGQGAVLDVPSNQRARGRTYWDVAVIHDDDTAAREVLDQLVPGRLDVG